MLTRSEHKPRPLSPTAKIACLLYSLLCYLCFLLGFLYFIGFLGNVAVPKSIDSGPGIPWPQALLVDVLLISLFAVQHSVMARKSFKLWWQNFVPAPIERATYVLASSAVLALMCWWWQPIDTLVWKVDSPLATGLLSGLFWFGWGLVFLASALISHFELFGIKQALDTLRKPRAVDSTFKTPLLYKIVRHPLYLGFLIAFWATPAMTVGHLVFALTSTVYIMIGWFLEEKDLVEIFGEKYRHYQKTVGMLLPFPHRKPDPQD